jgi:hypothetical protein
MPHFVENRDGMVSMAIAFLDCHFVASSRRKEEFL